MLVNKVTLSKRQDHDCMTPVVYKDKTGAILGAELPNVYLTAKVFRCIDSGELVPFKIDPVNINQEYETDPFSFQETEAYKKALYSDKGRLLVNELKNSKLVNMESFTKFITACKGANLEKLLHNRHVKSLLQTPKFTHKRKVNFSVEGQLLNRLSLKDLGITKQDIMAVFKKHKLVTV